MAYHPENVEVPLGQIKIEHRKTKEGGVEQIAVIPPEVIAKSLASMYYGSLGDLVKNFSVNLDSEGEKDSAKGRKMLANSLYCVANYLDMAESSLRSAEDICKRFMEKFEGGYRGK